MKKAGLSRKKATVLFWFVIINIEKCLLKGKPVHVKKCQTITKAQKIVTHILPFSWIIPATLCRFYFYLSGRNC